MTVNAIYGIPAEAIATICQVDASTARRWKSGERRIPYAAQALISGDLGAFSKQWQGWRVQGDALLSPDGWKISRQDALTVPVMQSQISALRAELETYKDLQHLREHLPRLQLARLLQQLCQDLMQRQQEALTPTATGQSGSPTTEMARLTNETVARLTAASEACTALGKQASNAVPAGVALQPAGGMSIAVTFQAQG